MAMEKDWKGYFADNTGRGYISTADSEGKTDLAVYSRPHIQQDGRWAFIMNQGRSFANVSQNPHAAYAFEPKGGEGYRFYLQNDEILIEGELYDAVIGESRKPAGIQDSGIKKYVVLFRLVEIRPLVGG